MGTQAEGQAASTAVATTAPQHPLEAMRAARIAELREKNRFAAAIKGTAWGKDLNGLTIAAVAHYCTIHGLDPARHVEVLGGRLYHTGELYEERGMPLVRAGIVTYSEPQFVHEDPELTRLALAPEGEDPLLVEWAKGERRRRVQARIDRGIPHDATGACVYVGEVIAESGQRTPVVGFNWCGGKTKIKTKRDGSTYRGDPVGDAEPTKTAQSRAKRRFWRQVVEANPVAGAEFAKLEASAKIANAEIAESLTEEAERGARITAGTPSHPTPLANLGDDPYATEPTSVATVPIAVAGDESLVGEVCSLHGFAVSDAQRCPGCEADEIAIDRAGQ